MSKAVSELSEDIEVLGPGQILSEARIQMQLSISDVAQRLNFRIALVEAIEKDQFDKSLPDTFNRGYLKNYAKLVGIPEQDILASYEMLGVAAQQGAEMQSFSKITEKQAQNSRLMWISYFIFALFIALSVLYWLQDAKTNNTSAVVDTSAESTVSSTDDKINDTASTPIASQLKDVPATAENMTETAVVASVQSEQPLNQSLEQSLEQSNLAVNPISNVETLTQQTPDGSRVAQANQSHIEKSTGTESVAVFTFAGDCWVNIYDAAGERIAWGIKKTGYVMNLKGMAPFNVTVGKPELVSIVFNDQEIDMAKFNVGNIAKFTLPETR